MVTLFRKTPFSETIWVILHRSIELTKCVGRKKLSLCYFGCQDGQPVQVYGLVEAWEMCWNVLVIFTATLK